MIGIRVGWVELLKKFRELDLSSIHGQRDALQLMDEEIKRLDEEQEKQAKPVNVVKLPPK